MPKDSSHRFYPPGTFRNTDLRDRLNNKRDNSPNHPPFNGQGGGHQRGAPYGARPKTNGRSYHTGSYFHQQSQQSNRSYHAGSQSYYQQKSQQSGPRSQPQTPHSLSQVNISHRTFIVNNGTDPVPSNVRSSLPAARESTDDYSACSTVQNLSSLHETPKFRDIATMTDIYFNKHRSDLEVSAVLKFLGTTRNDASTQTDFHENSSSLLDFYTNVRAPYSDEFNPIPPISEPCPPSYAADVFSIDSSQLPDANVRPLHRKDSYNLDLETLIQTTEPEPIPNLLIEETKTMLNSLSLSGAPSDLLSYLNQAPLLPATTCTLPNQFSTIPSTLAMDTNLEDEFNLIPELSSQYLPDDTNLDESL